MKRILFSCMVAFMAGNSNAQVLFTQNFDTGSITDYVRTNNTTPTVAIGDNMLTYASVANSSSGGTSVTINAGKLRLARTTSATGDNGMGISRTANNAAPNGKLAVAASSVIKFSCELTVSGYVADNKANLIFFQIGGNALNQTGAANFNATSSPTHSMFAISINPDGTYRLSRPAASGNNGSVAPGVTGDWPTASYASGTTLAVTWYINNSGQYISSYLGPDGTTPYTLVNDTYDLFVGNDRVLEGRAAVNAAEEINNFSIGIRNYTGSPAITLDVDNIIITNITNQVTLPVSLTTFTGSTATAGNLLKWQTASEQQNSHFDILRSTDGKEFAQIGREEGKGTTTEVTNYQFTDYNPAPGVNYYKLRQVDFNGNSEESRVVSINPFHQKENLSINAADNNLEVRYQSEKAGAAQFAIHDINGRLLLKQETSVTAGENVFSCPVILVPGIYVGSVNAGGTVIQTKFQK